MTKKILIGFIFSVMLLFVGLSASYSGEPNPKLETDCLRTIVKVFDFNEGTSGSGVIIRSEQNENKEWVNIILTCRHVTDDLKSPGIAVVGYSAWSQVSADGGGVYPAIILAHHDSLDLALMLSITPQQLPVAELGVDEKNYISNNVIITGCGNGFYPRLRLGHITEVYANTIRTDITVVPGDSGGGLFDESHKLIGIVWGFLTSHSNQEILVFNWSGSTPVSSLKEWGKQNKAVLAYDAATALPKLPIIMLKSKQFTEPTTSLLDVLPY